MKSVIVNNKEWHPIFEVSHEKIKPLYEHYIRLVTSHGISPEPLDVNRAMQVLLETIATADEAKNDCWLDHELVEIICTIGVTSLEELRVATGIYLGDGLFQAGYRIALDIVHRKIIDFPVSREDLYTRLTDTKMDRAAAYNLVQDLSHGKGLSEEMRDELWMGFAPEWLVSFCEKICNLACDNDICDYMTIILTIAQFKAEERVVELYGG